MYIVEFVFPGSFLASQDNEWVMQTRRQLQTLVSTVEDAAIALTGFERQCAHRRAFKNGARSVSPAGNEVLEAAAAAHYDEASLQFSEVQRRRRQWEAGELPPMWFIRTAIVYARSFLYSVDRAQKVLRSLQCDQRTPDGVRSALEELEDAVPGVRHLRNSSAHLEDRVRGLGLRGQPVDLQPVENEFFSAPGGGLMMTESLLGTSFSATAADGNLVKLEVSLRTLRILQTCVQSALNSYKWTGPPQHHP